MPRPRRPWPSAEIGRLAARQLTMVTNAQLRQLGLDRRTIARAVARGSLYVVHRGVYSLVPPPARLPLAAEQAGLLACGPRAVLSHRSAARLHGLRVSASRAVELTVAGADRRHPGLLVHRCVELDAADRGRRGRLAVTSVPRTVVDLAPQLGERPLEHLLDEALRIASRAKFEEALGRLSGRPGVARLHALLDPARASSDTWSAAEERLLRLIRAAGLPSPEANVALGDYVPDLMWRPARVIVEFDSVAHHSGSLAHGRDAARHNDLTAQGWQVLHVTWEELTRHPERVLVWIAAALARAGA